MSRHSTSVTDSRISSSSDYSCSKLLGKFSHAIRACCLRLYKLLIYEMLLFHDDQESIEKVATIACFRRFWLTLDHRISARIRLTPKIVLLLWISVCVLPEYLVWYKICLTGLASWAPKVGQLAIVREIRMHNLPSRTSLSKFEFRTVCICAQLCVVYIYSFSQFRLTHIRLNSIIKRIIRFSEATYILLLWRQTCIRIEAITNARHNDPLQVRWNIRPVQKTG